MADAGSLQPLQHHQRVSVDAGAGRTGRARAAVGTTVVPAGCGSGRRCLLSARAHPSSTTGCAGRCGGSRADLDGAAAARANRPWFPRTPPTSVRSNPGVRQWTTAQELTLGGAGGVKCALTCAVPRPCRSTPSARTSLCRKEFPRPRRVATRHAEGVSAWPPEPIGRRQERGGTTTVPVAVVATTGGSRTSAADGDRSGRPRAHDPHLEVESPAARADPDHLGLDLDHVARAHRRAELHVGVRREQALVAVGADADLGRHVPEAGRASRRRRRGCPA